MAENNSKKVSSDQEEIKPMMLTEEELHWMQFALKELMYSNTRPELVRLQRKLARWADHPDLIFNN